MKIVTVSNYWYYNLKSRYSSKFKVGAGMRIRGFARIDVRGKCEIGEGFVFNSGMQVNPMGRNIQGCIYVGCDGVLKIGDNVGLSSATVWCDKSIVIEDYAQIGAGTIITDTDSHSLVPHIRKNREEDYLNARKAPVHIGENVLVGANSIILKGVSIGKNSVVGAGSVVTHDIPDNEIWAGNPANFIKETSIN